MSLNINQVLFEISLYCHFLLTMVWEKSWDYLIVVNGGGSHNNIEKGKSEKRGKKYGLGEKGEGRIEKMSRSLAYKCQRTILWVYRR